MNKMPNYRRKKNKRVERAHLPVPFILAEPALYKLLSRQSAPKKGKQIKNILVPKTWPTSNKTIFEQNYQNSGFVIRGTVSK